VEVVHEKDESTYRRVLGRHGVDPTTFLMVGNSLRSDAAPVLALGGWAAHVPHELTWALEHLDDDGPIKASPRFRGLTSLRQVAALVTELAG
jgi:putative hydrolase of the HAD superfamily